MNRCIKFLFFAAGLYFAAPLPAAAALVSTASENTAPQDAILIAQGSCSAAASQAAAQSGGQVLSVTMAQQGGRTVCVVTLLVPGRDGGRPRRTTVTVPQ
ncbi:hypothetical protein FPY71_11485 [Aureimonas fodinaquatilis]|uniref:Secreted protein n=1 Tax=Aureimonas fodinaquatilis TaxID=2565783 RepID=A0A5B0DZT8_9HYPH|nr:hypothetical protein FPY71_11485 [Aureimonas fodinaquatilis]